MASLTRAPKSSSALQNGLQGPLSPSKAETEPEIQMYLQLWIRKECWLPPGFIIEVTTPHQVDIQTLLSRVGKREHYNPLTLGPLLHKEQLDKILALNSLVVLFQAMLSKQGYYHSSRTEFYEMVGAEVKGGVAYCRSFAEMYVTGRRAYLYRVHPSYHFASLITDLVDRWISYLDNIASRQLNTPEVERHSTAQALSRPALNQSSPNETKLANSFGTTSNPKQRKREREDANLEHQQVKRTHTSFEPNHHNVLDDADRAPNSVARSGARKEESVFLEDNLNALEASAPAFRVEDSSPVQSSVMTTSQPSPLSKVNVGADNSDTIGAAFENLSRLVERSHERFEGRHRKMKRKVADTDATIADIRKTKANTGTVGQLSNDLAEQRQIQKLVQTSVDSKFEEQDGQLADLRVRMERQERSGASQKVRETLKMEEILDRHHLNQQREMDSLRATVAAQASTIEEQGKHIAEMRQQMCKLSEEQGTTLSRGRNGLWSKGSAGQWGKDDGPLWTPQR